LVKGVMSMEVDDIVKWVPDEIGFKGRTFRIVRFEFRDRKLMAVCKIESEQSPFLGLQDAPKIPEAVDFVFELNELQVLP